MTLKQIDERLALFPEYIRYLLEAKINRHVYLDISGLRDLTADTVMNIFSHQGYLLVNSMSSPSPSYQPYTFDQWLYQNKHEDLVLFEEPKYITKTHNGITYNLLNSIPGLDS